MILIRSKINAMKQFYLVNVVKLTDEYLSYDGYWFVVMESLDSGDDWYSKYEFSIGGSSYVDTIKRAEVDLLWSFDNYDAGINKLINVEKDFRKIGVEQVLRKFKLEKLDNKNYY